MKISEQWLREFVDVDLPTNELAEQLTMAGLEVDSIEPAAPEFTGVVVAQIIKCEPHPDADKLQVCKVNTGSEEVQIVCGAKNAREGLIAPLATIGGKLPGDFKIKKAKLRGVESFGMLCSAKEIGIAESAEGLLELPTDAPVGTDIRDYLQLNDTIIEVDLTPNRSDCLGMTGVAREVGVITRSTFTEKQIDQITSEIDEQFPVEVNAIEQCPRYAGRVITGVNPKAETPIWMQEKLRRGGIRSLSPVVDITNYILLELGQPMHAFDVEKLHGCIVVRMAKDGEELELLDGQTIKLKSDSLVISDKTKPCALAGVMGGLESSVTDDTKDIFLESAFFTPKAIAGKARNYGLHTDSSHRFERGVDPELQIKAIELATKLILDITGGKPGPVIEAASSEHMPKMAVIKLRRDRIAKVLGISLIDADVEDILIRLGFDVSAQGDGWEVTVPLFRFDVSIEEDLIEELGRVYGYNNIPRSNASSNLCIKAIPEKDVALTSVQKTLIDREYQEAITYSFVCPKTQELITPGAEQIKLANPISADMQVMRSTIWTGLIKAAVYNRNRQNTRVRLFETGLVFAKDGEKVEQNPSLAGIIFGSRLAEQWSQKADEVDFFDIKGDVEALLALGGATSEYQFIAEKHNALHPGQSAKIMRGEQFIGWVGAIHPALAKKLDLPTKTYMFELNIEQVTEGSVPKFEKLSKFPQIKRDLAIVVDESIAADSVLKAAAEVQPEIVKEVRLFDVYRGKGVEENCKSLAISLILRHFSRTLIDNEVDAIVEQVVNKLADLFGAKLR